MEKEKDLDIHNYKHRMEKFVEQLKNLSEANRQLILEFDEYCEIKDILNSGLDQIIDKLQKIAGGVARN